ncbi:MAG: PQQ-binding-like beta-propeller repeat protein [Caldisericia bacterium]|nr:PQQ-binding-like beta-propeller repeat protein [Caldisericia bacterium]
MKTIKTNAAFSLLLSIFVFCSILVNIPFVTPVYAEGESNWPTFHQNESRTGVSPELIQVDGLLEQWRFQTGSSISSSPVIQNNIVYTVADNRKVYAIDANNGEKIWETETRFLNYPLPYGSPTYSNGKLYFATGGASDVPSYMYCLRDDGTELWKFVAYGQITSSSALVYGDKVFFGTSTEFLYVLNANGSEIQRIPLNGSIISSPVMGAGRVFAVTSGGRLYAYDYSDLKPLFDQTGIQLPIGTSDECKSSPVYMDGIIYVSSRSADSKGEVFAINAYTGEMIWRSGNIGNFISTPAITQNYLFIGDEDGKMFALKRSDGKVKWKVPTSGRIVSSPAVTGEYVIFGGGDGKLYALSTETGETAFSTLLGNEINTSPIITKNKIIISFSSTCVCFSDDIDFGISANPANVSMYQGEEKDIAITIQATTSFSQNVFLRVGKTPLGIETVLSPNIVKMKNGHAVSKLKLIINKETKPGNYVIEILGETQGRTRKVSIGIEVLEIEDGTFAMKILPPSVETDVGKAVVFTVEMTSPDGFHGAVNLDLIKDHPGFTCRFSNNSLIVPGSTQLIVVVDVTADPDSYPFAVQAKGGGKSVVERLTITVKGTKRLDWNGFGNTSSINNFTTESVSNKLERRYTYQTDSDAIRCQPAIIGNTIYFVGEKELSDGHHSTKLYAIERTTGELIWEYYLGQSNRLLSPIGEETEDDPPPWTCSPRIFEEKLFVGTLDGIFFCFNRETGRPIWYRNVGSSIRSTACVGDGKVYFGTETGEFYALSIEGGEQRWMNDYEAPIYSSPAYRKNRVYVSTYDNYLYCVSSVNGLPFAKFNGFRASYKSSPNVGKEGIYIGGGGENLFFYRVNKSMTMKWQILTYDEVPNTPALDEEERFVYFIGVKKNKSLRIAELRKINTKTKEEEWVYSAGGGAVTTSPVIADDKILFGSLDKNFTMLDTTGRLVWKQQLDAAIQGSPAVGRGVVVVGTNSGKLYCFSSSVGFTLVPETQSVTLFQGGDVNIKISVVNDIPLKNPVQFQLENVPSGTHYEFTPNQLKAAPGECNLHIQTTKETPTGSHSLLVIAFSGTIKKTTRIQLRVQNVAPGQFSLSSNETNFEVNAGTTIRSEINISRIGGYNAPVTMGLKEAPPEGVEVIFNPPIVPCPGQTTAKMHFSPNVTPGEFDLVLQGQGGGKHAELVYHISVFETMQGDFTVKSTPSYQEIYAGESTTYEITAAGYDGFNELINLDVSGLPEYLNYSLSKKTISSDESSTLTINTSQGLNPEEIKFYINAKANKTDKQIPLYLNIVIEYGDFSLNLEPNTKINATAGTQVQMVFKPSFSMKWTAPVSFSIGNSPEGVKATISPSTISKKDFGSEVVITFHINPDLDSQEFSINLQGIGGGKTRTAMFKLYILSIKNGYAALNFDPIYPQLKIEKPTPIEITIQGAKDLSYIEFDIHFDPIFVKLVGITPSKLLTSQTGKSFELLKTINQEEGVAFVKIIMEPGYSINDSGSLISLSLQGINKGTTTVSIKKASSRTTTLNEFPIIGSQADALVTKYLAGDVNGDGSVDINDLALFATVFGTTKEDTNFDPRCDFNDDGKIDGIDLIILSYNFGESI